MQYLFRRSLAVAVAGLALSVASLAAAAVPGTTAPETAAEQLALRLPPALVEGLWCGAGLLHEFRLEIAQRYQRVEARLIRKNKVREITGRMEGTTLRTDPLRDHIMELRTNGDELRIVGATGVLALAKGQFFTRAAGASCTH